MILKNIKNSLKFFKIKNYFCKNNFNILIPFEKKKCEFCLYNDWNMRNSNNPITNYYFNMHDLSINAIVEFRLGLWGFEFFYGILGIFNSHPTEWNDGIPTMWYDWSVDYKLHELYPNIIQDLQKIEIEPVQLFVNEKTVENEMDFLNIILKYEELNSDILINNTVINFKLKLNINQYIMLTTETLIPVFSPIYKKKIN